MTDHASSMTLVVFDLGGVLVRLVRGFGHACERAGVALPEGFDEARFREGYLPIVVEHETGRADQDQTVRRFGELAGMDDHAAGAVLDAWLIDPFAGVDSLLDRLDTAGVVTACLSNINPGHWAIVTDPAGACPLPLERLSHRFASHLLGVRKPNAAIYHKVEQQTGAAPERIVFFDDNQPNVEAARQRGWHAYRVDPLGDPPPPAQATEHLERLGVL